MEKYIVKANIMEGNPEYTPDKELQDGLESDGFLLMTMKDGRPGAVVLMGITTLDLARMLAGGKSEAGSVIRQAIAIAEGLNKAAEIAKEESKTNMAREIAEMLRSK